MKAFWSVLSFTTSPCTYANPAHKLQQWVFMDRWNKFSAELEMIPCIERTNIKLVEMLKACWTLQVIS